MWAAASNREGPRGQQKISHVQLDGLVLLKIIKHCKENFPEHVAGSLLGLDVEDTLQVTHRFAPFHSCPPFPPTSMHAFIESVCGCSYSFPTSVADGGGDDYELDMMKALRKVNVDNNRVGWYQSTFLGSYWSVRLSPSLPPKPRVPLTFSACRAAQKTPSFTSLSTRRVFLTGAVDGGPRCVVCCV
jgi:hypothetical protein